MSYTLSSTSIANLSSLTERYLKNRDVKSPGDAIWITYCIENEFSHDHELALQLMTHAFRCLEKTTNTIRDCASEITHKSATPL